MFGSTRARSALLLTLLTALAAPARADRDVVGVTRVKFSWTAASGDDVAYYRVYVERNGGGFMPHPLTPIKLEGSRIVAVAGAYGDVIRVQVAAIASVDGAEGPRSDPSERIRFVATSTAPPETPPTETPPTSPPPTGPGSGSGSGSGSGGADLGLSSPDFDGDGHADLLLRDGTSGRVMVWTMDANGASGALETGSVPPSSAIVGNGDYDGDGHADLLSRDDATGTLTVRLLADGVVQSGAQLPAPASPEWDLAASADFDGDGRDDALLRNARKGQLEIWYLNGTSLVSRVAVRGASYSENWQVAGAGDFDGDGRADILWHHAEKRRAEVALVDARPAITKTLKLFKTETESDVVALGDADGNGLPDVVVRERASGLLGIRFTELVDGRPRAEVARAIAAGAGNLSALSTLEVQGGGDYDGDDGLDLVLRNPANGDLRVWYLDAATLAGEVRLLDPGADWVFEGVGAESPATHR